jgi:hypothetical protein
MKRSKYTNFIEKSLIEKAVVYTNITDLCDLCEKYFIFNPCFP